MALGEDHLAGGGKTSGARASGGQASGSHTRASGRHSHARRAGAGSGGSAHAAHHGGHVREGVHAEEVLASLDIMLAKCTV